MLHVARLSLILLFYGLPAWSGDLHLTPDNSIKFVKKHPSIFQSLSEKMLADPVLLLERAFLFLPQHQIDLLAAINGLVSEKSVPLKISQIVVELGCTRSKIDRLQADSLRMLNIGMKYLTEDWDRWPPDTVSIRVLNLPVRTEKALMTNGIVTIQLLRSKNVDDLSLIRNLGIDSLDKVESALATYEAKLAD